MAAADPKRRSEAARKAAQDRWARLGPEERRKATAPATAGFVASLSESPEERRARMTDLSTISAAKRRIRRRQREAKLLRSLLDDADRAAIAEAVGEGFDLDALLAVFEAEATG